MVRVHIVQVPHKGQSDKSDSSVGSVATPHLNPQLYSYYKTGWYVHPKYQYLVEYSMHLRCFCELRVTCTVPSVTYGSVNKINCICKAESQALCTSGCQAVVHGRSKLRYRYSRVRPCRLFTPLPTGTEVTSTVLLLQA